MGTWHGAFLQQHRQQGREIGMGKTFQPEVQKAIELVWMKYDEESSAAGQALLRKAACAGDADAWALLARTYMGAEDLAVWEDSGLPVDEDEADECLKWSLLGGSPLGVICAIEHRSLFPWERAELLSRWGSPQKVLEAAEAYADEPMGAHLLGMCYATGAAWGLLGNWEDETKEKKARLAAPFLEKALEKDFALSLDAYSTCADIIREDTGNGNKAEKARVWEERFIRLGVPHVIYEKARRVYDEEDYEAALRLYKEAAERDHLESMYNIGFMCLYGIGAEKDAATALHLLSNLGEMGYVPAMCQTADIYFWGALGERDFASAYSWCERALDRIAELAGERPREALYSYEALLPMMCYCKYFGEGTVIDREMAVRTIVAELERQEQERTFSGAKMALLQGLMAEVYANGSGGYAKDKEKARYYRQQAKSYEDYEEWLGDLEWEKSSEGLGDRFVWALFGRSEKDKTPLTDVENIRSWQEERIKKARMSWKRARPRRLWIELQEGYGTGFWSYTEKDIEKGLELLWQGVYCEMKLEEETGDYLVAWWEDEKIHIFAEVSGNCSRREARDIAHALTVFMAWYRGEGLIGDGWQEDERGNKRVRWNEIITKANECHRKGDKAGRWAILMEGADEGCSKAMLTLGEELAEAGDFKGAAVWFLNATRTEEAEDKAWAWYHLGRLYMERPEEKGIEAYYHLQRAADMGLVAACVLLGKCYEKGIGTAKNLQEAVKCYDKALKYDYPPAMIARAGLYLDEGGSQGAEKAIPLLQKALKEDEADTWGWDARKLLVDAYLTKGTEEDRDIARYILTQEAKEGNSPAAHMLAHLCLEDGEGEHYREILRHIAAEGYQPAREELDKAYNDSSWSECL